MKSVSIGFIILLVAVTVNTNAQLCKNPKDTLYALNSITGSGSGQIVAINVIDTGSTLIGVPAVGSANANGLGFSAFNSKFYFFNQTGSGTTEFISYNAITGAKVPLAAAPATITTAQKIRSGTVDSAGTRYYTINPNATVPYFYFYNISTNTWVTVTSTFKDKNGNVVTDFKNLNSGDMTFDGAGNLWILCSSPTQYSLYKIKSPVPTTVVASITVDTIVSIRSNPVSGVSFTGIAFNKSGVLYMTTGSGVGAGNNKLYKLATATSALTLVGTLPNGYGDDLTSCVFPVAVLSSSWISFSASLQNKSVGLTWKVNETDDVSGYTIEFSNDAEHWQTFGSIEKTDNSTGLKTYNYIHSEYVPGKNYYRVIQLFRSGKETISETRLVDTRNISKIYIGPNPANDIIYLNNKDNSSRLLAKIFDTNGRLVYSAIVAPDQQSINISRLPRGNFVLRLSSPVTNESPEGYHFIKW